LEREGRKDVKPHWVLIKCRVGLGGSDRHGAPARQSCMVPAEQPMRCDAPTPGSLSERVPPDAMRLLTPGEQMALGLVTSDDPMPPSGVLLLAAASGLAKLSACAAAVAGETSTTAQTLASAPPYCQRQRTEAQCPPVTPPP